MTCQQIRNTIITLAVAGFSQQIMAQSADEQAMIQYQKQLEQLDKVNFHPNLLPLILKNRDFLELTPQQVTAFNTWRKNNAKLMFAVMNEIIRKRIEFREAALSPDTSADILRQKQQEIFALHEKVLEFKLSCRENITTTFSVQNWEDFFVVLAEEGYAIPTNSLANMEDAIISYSGMPE